MNGWFRDPNESNSPFRDIIRALHPNVNWDQSNFWFHRWLNKLTGQEQMDTKAPSRIAIFVNGQSM